MKLNNYTALLTSITVSIGLLLNGTVKAQGVDACGTAITQSLPIGGSLTLTGDNTSATATGDWAPGSNFAGAPVMWHSFSISDCANVTVSFCGLTPAWGNVFGILSTDCPADNLVTFSNVSTTSCGDGNTVYTWNSLAPGTYKLPVVKDVAQGSVGAYSVLLSAEACDLDFCNNAPAIPISVGETLTFTGDVTNATPTGDFVTTSPFAGAPVKWHAFTTESCTNITVSYCGTTAGWGTVFGILSTDCPADNTVNFSTTETCANGNVIYNWNDLPMGTYYVPIVLEQASGSVGPYSVTVSASNCFNDLCATITAGTLEVGSTLTFTGDNTNATATNDFVATSPFNGAPVVWHAVTTTQCSNITVAFCGQSPVFGNVFGFLSTTCPADQVTVFSTTTTCADGNIIYTYDAVPANTYYIPVVLDPGQNSIGAYSIEVSATGCFNDFCDQVSPDELVLGETLVFNGDNTNATAANDWVPGSSFAGAPVLWHAFTTTECLDVTVSYCGQDPVFSNVFGFFSRDCPAGDLVTFTSFSNTACGDGNYIYFWDNLEPGTYLMPVVLDPSVGQVGEYSVSVVGTSCFVGINEENAENWSVYPNPAVDQLVLNFNGSSGTGTIELLDLTGRIVLQETRILSQGGTYRFDLPTAVNSGTYVFRVVTESDRMAKRVIVK
ncbi:MAG: T9SS type A sorting domain-containing protein [Flavobacteriales bacterium]|nr:T9SS type A sorting domain-containing protein [Flavobacteriales bacterium]